MGLLPKEIEIARQKAIGNYKHWTDKQILNYYDNCFHQTKINDTWDNRFTISQLEFVIIHRGLKPNK